MIVSGLVTSPHDHQDRCPWSSRRSRVYEAIVKGENLPEPGLPESFNVLVKELQALGISVTLGA